jgi:plasmid maintenance system antidote protein VapI
MDSAGKDIEVQLREAIVGSEMSCYEIAKRTEMANSQLSLFINGHRSLTLTSAAKVARVLGLELRPIKTERKALKKKR